MSASTAVAVADGSNNELRELVKDAIAFAEEWPEPYRPQVFGLFTARRAGAPSVAAGAAPELAAEEAAPMVTPIATGGLSIVAKELGVEPRLLTRVVAINDDGKVSILGRIDARTKADLAEQYGAVLCYIRERALGQLDTPVADLRDVAKAHGGYDMDNFTSNLRRSKVLRELGEKGSHSRTYRLSTRGVEEAKALLKKMVEE
jgi:hypothetical protein